MRFDLTSMVGVLALMWVASLGCGLAVERLLRLRLPNALLLPLGLCATIVVIFPGYVAGVGDPLAISLLAVVALAGLVSAREGLPRRLNPGWPGVAGVGAYLLFMAPVLAHGSWTWTGHERSRPAWNGRASTGEGSHEGQATQGADRHRLDVTSGGGSFAGPALQGAAAADAAALAFAHATPDPELLTVGEGVLEAVLPNDAATADLLRLARRCAPLREEQVGIDAHAVGVPLPATVVFRSQELE